MFSPHQPTVQTPMSDKLFFAHILRNGPSSRATIAAEHKLSRPTASEAASRLVQRGVIRALSKEPGTTGRRGRVPELYDLVPDIGCTLTVRTELARFVVSLYDLRGACLHEEIRPTHWTDDRTAIEPLLEAVRETLPHANGPILACAISVLTTVNPRTQQVVLPEDSVFEGKPIDFYGELTSLLDCPVHVDSHMIWSLHSEVHHGVASSEENILTIHLGNHIGSALSNNGVVYRGAHGRAGSLRALRVRGERLNRIIREHGVVLEDDPVGRELGYLNIDATLERVMSNPEAENSQEFIHSIVEAIVNVVSFSDPDALVLTGPMTAHEEFTALLHRQITEEIPYSETSIYVSNNGPEATANGVYIGAHQLALASMGLVLPGQKVPAYHEKSEKEVTAEEV